MSVCVGNGLRNTVQSGAARHSQGFEDKNLGSVRVIGTSTCTLDKPRLYYENRLYEMWSERCMNAGKLIINRFWTSDARASWRFIQEVLSFLLEFPRLVGRYCSYLLPKQAGGTPQILVFKTLRMTSRPALYS